MKGVAVASSIFLCFVLVPSFAKEGDDVAKDEVERWFQKQACTICAHTIIIWMQLCAFAHTAFWQMYCAHSGWFQLPLLRHRQKIYRFFPRTSIPHNANSACVLNLSYHFLAFELT